MKKVKKKQYEAMGFAEALMAIMLVGVSSLVLLKIAIDTMENAIQNEAIDMMTQYAMEGAEMVQDIYNKHKIEQLINEDNPERYFPEIDPTDPDDRNCFVINKEDGDVYFVRDEDIAGEFIRFARQDRNDYRNVALVDTDSEEPITFGGAVRINEQFFRVVCLEGSPESDKPFMIARVIVGQRYFDEELFAGELYGNFVRDYEYLTVIKL